MHALDHEWRSLVVLAAATVLSGCDLTGVTAPCDVASAESGCPSQAAMTHDQKLEHFMELALPGGGGRIMRWSEPVSVEVRGGSEADRHAAQEAARRLSAASGHPIEVVESDGNVAIMVVPRADFGQYIVGASSQYAGTCAPLHDNRVIYAATIVVAQELPSQDRGRVILHELAHALGLVGHSTRYPGSLLYPIITRGTTILEQDRFALQALYQRDMYPGTTATQALTVLAGPH